MRRQEVVKELEVEVRTKHYAGHRISTVSYLCRCDFTTQASLDMLNEVLLPLQRLEGSGKRRRIQVPDIARHRLVPEGQLRL